MAFKIAEITVELTAACAEELKQHPSFAPYAEQIQEGPLRVPSVDSIFDKSVQEILKQHKAKGVTGVYRSFRSGMPPVIVGILYDGAGGCAEVKGTATGDGYTWETYPEKNE